MKKLLLFLLIVLTGCQNEETIKTEVIQEVSDYSNCELVDGIVIRREMSETGTIISVEDNKYRTVSMHSLNDTDESPEIKEPVVVRVCGIYNDNNELIGNYQADFLAY